MAILEKSASVEFHADNAHRCFFCKDELTSTNEAFLNLDYWHDPHCYNRLIEKKLPAAPCLIIQDSDGSKMPVCPKHLRQLAEEVETRFPT